MVEGRIAEQTPDPARDFVLSKFDWQVVGVAFMYLPEEVDVLMRPGGRLGLVMALAVWDDTQMGILRAVSELHVDLANRGFTTEEGPSVIADAETGELAVEWTVIHAGGEA
ncbi:MAG: hypothetical protein A3C90_00925 [Candidatus Magasanikbacteria bacterium RIFCSPHIGHO2_02_FULL_51_14]|uniref:Uncharacterized protein n=1 Tax=Candidatus Magasanikbacteria bacterium RIFCSPHIGHO2_02_FULL_51_14 TaxID=1798683 RepID=A0A1F6MQ74_9BACT|nr:MAG: hypothetical protein A3C90_00925 [Candidatus Magasanikbacteria bacterium RIFCSPHIGHO2_02_FULL_51_14]